MRDIAMPSLQVEKKDVCKPLSAIVVGVARIGYGMRASRDVLVTEQ